MVLETVSLTVLVEIVNVALAAPASTVTLAGTVTGSTPDNDTATPPAGAAALRVAVPVNEFPPTTLDVLSEIEDRSSEPAVTASIGD